MTGWVKIEDFVPNRGNAYLVSDGCFIDLGHYDYVGGPWLDVAEDEIENVRLICEIPPIPEDLLP